ncbi:hypothetical protein Tco_0380868 [Tanacetum coccineum]
MEQSARSAGGRTGDYGTKDRVAYVTCLWSCEREEDASTGAADRGTELVTYGSGNSFNLVGVAHGILAYSIARFWGVIWDSEVGMVVNIGVTLLIGNDSWWWFISNRTVREYCLGWDHCSQEWVGGDESGGGSNLVFGGCGDLRCMVIVIWRLVRLDNGVGCGEDSAE